MSHGPNFCLGAPLARIQMRAMFDAVLDQLGEVELAGEPVRLRSNFQNGIKHLPIRWRPTPTLELDRSDQEAGSA